MRSMRTSFTPPTVAGGKHRADMADDRSAEASLVDQLSAVEKAAVLDALLGSQPDLKPRSSASRPRC